MRESIGTSWIMVIVLTFIALFSGYLAFSINYSKAFKMKDSIIDMLEKHNGPTTTAVKEISDYMNTISYHSKGGCQRYSSGKNKYAGITGTNVNTTNPDKGTYNYCLYRIDAYNYSGQMTSAYYKVVVFFSLSLPMISDKFAFNASGETISLYFPDDDYLG